MRKRWVISSLRILFLVSFSFGGVHKAEAQKDILGEVQTIRKQISGTFNERISVPKGLGTSLWEVVTREYSGDVAERYDAYYNASFDYLSHGIKSARYAEEFAKNGDIETATKYLDTANSYVKRSQLAWEGAFEQLDSAFSIAKVVVVYEASKIALGVAVDKVGGGVVLDGISLYTDYLLDKELVGVDEATKNLINGALAKTFLMVPIARLGGKSLSEAINKGVTKTIGGSGIYSFLDELIGKPQFQKEFMRIASDSLGYIAIKEAEWLLEKLFDTPVVKKTEFKTQYAKSIPKDMNDLLYKITESEAFETFKNVFSSVTAYLPTTTKALTRVNQQDSTQSIANLDPGHPDLNVPTDNLVSVSPSAYNFSDNFSTGLGNWSASNAFTASVFGSVTSPDGTDFGIINTGLGFSASTGLLSRQIVLDTTTNITFNFKYNFVSTEFLDGIDLSPGAVVSDADKLRILATLGSGYPNDGHNDSFTAELHTPGGGTITLAGEDIASYGAIVGTGVSGLPTNVLDHSTGGETGWQTVNTTVSVPGGTSELHFHVADDPSRAAQDSAVLIDDVSLK